jgi:hypothetical protein
MPKPCEMEESSPTESVLPGSFSHDITALSVTIPLTYLQVKVFLSCPLK